LLGRETLVAEDLAVLAKGLVRPTSERPALAVAR